MNTQGESGLFPEAYVEEIANSDAEDGPPPAMAPPPLPVDYGATSSNGNMGWNAPAPAAASAAANDDDWGNSAGWGLPPVGKTNAQRQQEEQQWTSKDYNQAGSNNGDHGSNHATISSSNANTNQVKDGDGNSLRALYKVGLACCMFH